MARPFTERWIAAEVPLVTVGRPRAPENWSGPSRADWTVKWEVTNPDPKTQAAASSRLPARGYRAISCVPEVTVIARDGEARYKRSRVATASTCSAAGARRNFRRAGVLKKRSRTSMVVPTERPTSKGG